MKLEEPFYPKLENDEINMSGMLTSSKKNTH